MYRGLYAVFHRFLRFVGYNTFPITGWAAAAVREQLNVATGDKVQELNLQQISVALSAYVASDVQPPSRVLDQIGHRLEQVLKKEFDPDEITTALNSLALFGYQASETLIESIRASLVRTYFAEITPTQLATLMLAVAELGHRNTKLLGAVALEVIDRVEHFQPAELAEIMWSFAVLSHRHERMVDVITQSLLFQLSSMPPAAMSQMVCAFAVLKHKDAVTDVFLDAVCDEAHKKISEFEAGDMANMMWAYASLGHWGYVDAEWINAVVARMLVVYKVSLAPCVHPSTCPPPANALFSCSLAQLCYVCCTSSCPLPCCSVTRNGTGARIAVSGGPCVCLAL